MKIFEMSIEEPRKNIQFNIPKGKKIIQNGVIFYDVCFDAHKCLMIILIFLFIIKFKEFNFMNEMEFSVINTWKFTKKNSHFPKHIVIMFSIGISLGN